VERFENRDDKTCGLDLKEKSVINFRSFIYAKIHWFCLIKVKHEL